MSFCQVGAVTRGKTSKFQSFNMMKINFIELEICDISISLYQVIYNYFSKSYALFQTVQTIQYSSYFSSTCNHGSHELKFGRYPVLIGTRIFLSGRYAIPIGTQKFFPADTRCPNVPKNVFLASIWPVPGTHRYPPFFSCWYPVPKILKLR